MMHRDEQLLTTTNTVRLSFVLALLRDASIPVFVFDANIGGRSRCGVFSAPGYGAV